MHRTSIFLICGIITFFAFSNPSNAGEIGRGIGNCDLSGIFGCEWKPKGCFKPSKPFVFVSGASSYNIAVQEFNAYLDRISDYRQCVVADGKRDIEQRFQDIVVKGAQEEFDEIERYARCTN